MIVSMTGFGDAATTDGPAHYAVEVRSLNNRFFKAVIRLPDAVSALEPEVETLLRERLGRGSITLILKMRVEGADAAYVINQAALQSYVQQLHQVTTLGEAVRIDLSTLLTLPGVCQEPVGNVDQLEQHASVVRTLIAKALDRLLAMRRREGQALYEDLKKHLGVIALSLDEVEKRSPGVVDEYHRRLVQRVNELLSKAQLQIQQSDLAKEVAVFAERSDVAEELQRLRHHLQAFDAACRTGEHAGRKLDFLTQEMLREANTIGSKANDARIAGHVVEIKGAIDRMKEQVQNVE